jgi:hypothetical protein
MNKKEMEQKEEAARLEQERFKSRKLFNRIAKVFVPPPPPVNMPKRQPCPTHGGNCKRVNRTVGGAIYHCPRCGNFFVQAGVK